MGAQAEHSFSTPRAIVSLTESGLSRRGNCGDAKNASRTDLVFQRCGGTSGLSLFAGSTGSALRAVRPPNLYITPDVRRDLVRPLTRPGSCTSARPLSIVWLPVAIQ